MLEMCERTSDALEEVDEALTADSARAGAGADPCAGVTAVGQRVHASVAAFGTAVSCMLMSAEALASRCRTHGVTSQLESRYVIRLGAVPSLNTSVLCVPATVTSHQDNVISSLYGT